MNMFKYALMKQPIILIFVAMALGVSIAEFSNAYDLHKNANKYYSTTVNSVAKLEGIVEDVDRLEIKEYEVYRDGEKLELSPESELIVRTYENHLNRPSFIAGMTMGFDVIVLAFFISFCNWVYFEDLAEQQRAEIKKSKGVAIRACERLAEVASRSEEYEDQREEILEFLRSFEDMDAEQKEEIIKKIHLAEDQTSS